MKYAIIKKVRLGFNKKEFAYYVRDAASNKLLQAEHSYVRAVQFCNNNRLAYRYDKTEEA